MIDRPKMRGRPKGIARQIAEESGVNLRTVQRALAKKDGKEVTPEDQTLRRFMEVFRNFATFCRENSFDNIGELPISAEQVVKIREWNMIVRPWLDRLNGGAGDPPTS